MRELGAACDDQPRIIARMWNRRDEARTTPPKSNGCFTEGFDTVDLKDAKALLDELNE
jgi:hypothetical protein